MPSGTRTLRTCWKAEPTCGPCRSCSVMPTWRRPRSTPTSPANACGPSTNRPTPVPDPTSTKLEDARIVAVLWDDYGKDKEGGARERLILHYSPLVKFVAGRVAAGLPQSIEQSDLVSYGIFGLIDAIDKFDLDRGFKFETYAISRIKGAIIDELRSIDWVPRSVRAKARNLEKAYSKLEAQLHRTPTDAELAEELDLTDNQLQQTFSQISFIGLVALDETLSGAGERGESRSLGDTVA